MTGARFGAIGVSCSVGCDRGFRSEMARSLWTARPFSPMAVTAARRCL